MTSPPVRITWTDALFEWESSGEAPPSYEVVSYGVITGTSPGFTSIAAEVMPDGSYRAVTHIPNALITPGGIVALEEGDR